MSTDIRTIAYQVADELDIDRAYAVESAATYLAQCAEIDGVDYDEDDIPQSVADFVTECLRQDTTEVARPDMGLALDRLQAAAESYATTRDSLDTARQIRVAAAREARKAGATLEDIRLAGRFGALSHVQKILGS